MRLSVIGPTAIVASLLLAQPLAAAAFGGSTAATSAETHWPLTSTRLPKQDGAFVGLARNPSASFTYPASGQTVTSKSGTNTITWTESDGGGGGIASRTLTQQRGPVVSAGSCAGVTWVTRWSGSYTSPFTTAGYESNYCYRYTLSLTNGAGLTGSASSGNLLIDLGQSAPAATISRYMGTVGLQAHYDLGCDRARKNVSGAIALIYGMPVLVAGQYGASIYSGPDATVTQIGTAAKQFVQGYRDCAGNAPLITLMLSVTNYDLVQGAQVTSAHGSAWASMVNDVASWTIAHNFASLVDVEGGGDLEPGFASTARTRAWVNGYDVTNNRKMFNLGSADGCPQSGAGTTDGPCNNGWKQSDVLYVSWLASPSYALPQIYTNSGSQSKQWRYIKLYGVVSLSRIMTISGALTQSNACAEVGCGSTNTPAQGWQQLYDQLNADPRTAQFLTFSTDISWQK